MHTYIYKYINIFIYIYPVSKASRDFPRRRLQRFSDTLPESGGTYLLIIESRRTLIEFVLRRSASVNKCSISCSLNVRFLVEKGTKRAGYETLTKWLRFNGKLPITWIAPSMPSRARARYADSRFFP